MYIHIYHTCSYSNCAPNWFFGFTDAISLNILTYNLCLKQFSQKCILSKIFSHPEIFFGHPVYQIKKCI